MTDDMIAPLMNSIENKEENMYNEYNDIPIKEEKIEIHRDNDNELTNLLNNERNNRQRIINYFRTINIDLNDDKKKGIVFLSFVIQLLIYFLLLKFSLNKIPFLPDNNVLLYILSCIMALIFFYQEKLIEIIPIYLLIIAFISTIIFYFYLYELCIILSFQIFTYLLFASLAMYLFLSFFYFFEFVQSIVEAILKSFIIIFFCCLLIFIFRIADFYLSLLIFIFVELLNIVSLIHVYGLFNLNMNTKNRNLLLHMSLFMEINLTVMFVSSFILRTKLKNITKKNKK